MRVTSTRPKLAQSRTMTPCGASASRSPPLSTRTQLASERRAGSPWGQGTAQFGPQYAPHRRPGRQVDGPEQVGNAAAATAFTDHGGCRRRRDQVGVGEHVAEAQARARQHLVSDPTTTAPSPRVHRPVASG